MPKPIELKPRGFHHSMDGRLVASLDTLHPVTFHAKGEPMSNNVVGATLYEDKATAQSEADFFNEKYDAGNLYQEDKVVVVEQTINDIHGWITRSERKKHVQ